MGRALGTRPLPGVLGGLEEPLLVQELSAGQSGATVDSPARPPGKKPEAEHLQPSGPTGQFSEQT